MFEGLKTTNFLELSNFILLTGIFFGITFLRYLFISGVFHYAFYHLLRKRYQHRILDPKPISQVQMRLEVFWSAATSLIFGISGTLMVISWQEGKTALYFDFEQYPIWYIPVSTVIALFLHETYYYWLHRLMHVPSVYRLMHKVHHDSIQTNTLTSFSFHPLESVMQALIIPLIVFLLPIHIYVLLFLLLLMTISGTLNHSGVELYPNRFERHWLGKWLIGASHHDLHHRRFRCNYGLYFTFWDRWMGTESEDYQINLKK